MPTKRGPVVALALCALMLGLPTLVLRDNSASATVVTADALGGEIFIHHTDPAVATLAADPAAPAPAADVMDTSVDPPAPTSVPTSLAVASHAAPSRHTTRTTTPKHSTTPTHSTHSATVAPHHSVPPANPNPKHHETGEASWYDAPAGTCAHPSLPFGTVVTVTDVDTGRSTTCQIEDRGPYAASRIIDMAQASFAQIASTNSGVANVRVSW